MAAKEPDYILFAFFNQPFDDTYARCKGSSSTDESAEALLLAFDRLEDKIVMTIAIPTPIAPIQVTEDKDV